MVGGGNSAAQLAVELAATHDVTVVTPTQPWYFRERVLGVSSYWWLRLTGALNAGADSRLSRYVRSRGDAVFGTELRDLHRAGGVRIRPHRVVAATGSTLRLADGSALEAPAVLWCTGFHPETAWIDIPGALDPKGEPIHREGASPVTGLHWDGPALAGPAELVDHQRRRPGCERDRASHHGCGATHWIVTDPATSAVPRASSPLRSG